MFGAVDQIKGAHYTFTLDEIPDGQYALPADNSVDPKQPFLYNQTLYSTQLFSNGPHTFTLQNGVPGVDSFILLDYMIYTT